MQEKLGIFSLPSIGLYCCYNHHAAYSSEELVACLEELFLRQIIQGASQLNWDLNLELGNQSPGL